jgi:hypothetical protein
VDDEPFLKHDALELSADGDAEFSGVVTADDFRGETVTLSSGDPQLPAAVVTLARVTGAGTAGRISSGYQTMAGSHRFEVDTDGDGVRVYLNQSRWGPLDIDPTDEAHDTGGTGEDVLRTVTIPADSLDDTGALRVTAYFSFAGTAAAKTINIDFGGTQVMSLDVPSTAVRARVEVIIQNTTKSTQVAHGWLITEDGDADIAEGSASEDTESDQDLEIIGSLQNAGDDITLLHSHVEFLGATADRL